VLAISSPYLADSSTVSIGSGAWLALNTAGATDTVAKLFIDGVQMRAGTYGSTASGATYQDDTTFAGNGRLNVLSGPPAGSAYDTWATTTHGLSGGAAAFDSDYDHDGIANGLEWLFGGDPTRNDSQLIRPTMSGSPAGGLTVVFSRARSSITETTLVVEWGSALGALSNSVVIGSSSVGPNGIRPTVDIDVPAAGQVTVHIPAANAAGGKLFARLKATRP